MNKLNYGKNRWQPRKIEERLNKKPNVLKHREKQMNLKHK